MSKRHKGQGRSSPFVRLDHWLLKTDAWRDLDPVARALYVEIRIRYTGFNNGSIGLGTREASQALHIGRTTVQRAFDDLVDRGFIRLAQASTFDQKRLSREWLITGEKDDRNGHPTPKDFASWKPSQKQNAGPSQDRIGPSQDRSFPSVPTNSAHRSPGEPMTANSVDLQARMGTTYRSTTGRVRP